LHLFNLSVTLEYIYFTGQIIVIYVVNFLFNF